MSIQLSHATIHILAKNGDAQAEQARQAWISLIDYQDSTLVVECKYISITDQIEVGLIWKMMEDEYDLY